MKTLQDFLETLDPVERAFLKHMEKLKHQLEGYILLEGKPVKTTLLISMMWQCRNPEAIRVGKEMVGDTEVSTVFITQPLPGGNHYETMTFGPKEDRIQRRYKTLAQAREGHAAIVKKLRQG